MSELLTPKPNNALPLLKYPLGHSGDNFIAIIRVDKSSVNSIEILRLITIYKQLLIETLKNILFVSKIDRIFLLLSPFISSY